MASRRRHVPTDVNLLDLNTRKGFREAPAVHDIMMLATYLLVETAGLPSLVDFYSQLGAYFASEAAKIGLESTSQANQMVPFRNEFFDFPERYQKLDEIFQSAFGRTMEAFADEFRDSLANQIGESWGTSGVSTEILRVKIAIRRSILMKFDNQNR